MVRYTLHGYMRKAYMIENDDYDAIDGFHSLCTKEVCKIH